MATHDVNRLSQTCQTQILMFPHQHIQPSHEAQHVGIVIHLSQPIRVIRLDLIPNIPLVKGDFDWLGWHTEVDSVDLS